MPQVSTSTSYDRVAVRRWAEILAKPEFPTGPMEVVSTLINLSEEAPIIEGELADYLRRQLSKATFTQDAELAEVGDTYADSGGHGRDPMGRYP